MKRPLFRCRFQTLALAQTQQTGPSPNGVAPLRAGELATQIAARSVAPGSRLGAARSAAHRPHAWLCGKLIRRTSLLKTFDRFALAYRLAFELQPVGIMHQTVKDRVGNSGVVDQLMPLFDRKLAGHKRRP